MHALPLHPAFAICQRCQRPYLTIPLFTFDASQRPFLIWVKCDTPLTRIKSDQRFCQIWLARASKAPLLTFDSSQRHDNFDASQSCVKADVKSAPTPLIRVSKIVVQLWPHFWCESKMDKANFSCSTPDVVLFIDRRGNCPSLLFQQSLAHFFEISTVLSFTIFFYCFAVLIFKLSFNIYLRTLQSVHFIYSLACLVSGLLQMATDKS